MPTLLSDIPGLEEAVAAARAKEEEIREAAFLDGNTHICGIEVMQFSPIHFRRVCLVKSPLFYGGDIQPEHILQFLWIVSPLFKPSGELRQQFVSALHKHVSAAPAAFIDGISDYLRDAFMDRPTGGKSGPSIACMEASLAHRFATAYGWHEEKTLSTPFARLFQLMRLQDRDAYAEAGKEYVYISPLADRVKREKLAEFERSK